MIKISILTPSIRPAGLEIVSIGIRRQAFDPATVEWIVGMPEIMRSEIQEIVKPKNFTFIGCPPLQKGQYWDLNSTYNRMIKQASGDIILSLQDHTLITPQALSKFIYYMEKDPTAIITGVGDKYESVYPLLGAKTWTDPRRKGNTALHKVPFNEIEFNFCALPKKALYDVGLFAEDLDFEGYGLDGYSVMDRLNDLGGYNFYMDETNESYSMGHGRVADWEINNLIHGGYQHWKHKMQVIGTWPRLPYS